MAFDLQKFNGEPKIQDLPKYDLHIDNICDFQYLFFNYTNLAP